MPSPADCGAIHDLVYFPVTVTVTTYHVYKVLQKMPRTNVV